MIHETFLMTVAMIGLIIATVSDIRTREIPDWLNYGLIIAGFGTRIIYALTNHDFIFLLHGTIGFAIMAAIGFFMYYTKQWGGGDTKLIMGLGILLATFIGDLLTSIVTLIINIAIVGAAYGLLYSTVLAFKNWKKFKKEFKRISKEKKYIKIASLTCGVIIMGIILILIDDIRLKISLGIITIFILAYSYLLSFIKAVENVCMYKKIPVNKLTEGDWIAENIIINKKTIIDTKNLGLEKKHIALLKKHNIKKVLIKEGIPFVPSFLIAAIISFIIGNIILRF